MTKIPEPRDPTLEAVDEAIVKANQQEARTYYGASGAGGPCDRQNWYRWRWIGPEHISATGWRNILDGFASEPIMADRLQAVPSVRLLTVGPDERQFGVSGIGGHLRGHLDGVVKGLHQAPETWHVWEHKCVSEKRYRELTRAKDKHGEKNSLENFDPKYFVQAQLYMGLAKKGPIKRHYMTVASAGSRQTQSIRTEFQPEAFARIIERATEIINAKHPPPKISEDPNYYICKWCSFSEQCHGSKTAQVNCRTCAHSTPVTHGTDGKWHCGFFDRPLPIKEQRKGCPKHLFIPELLPWAHPHLLDEVNNQIHYRTDKGTEFVNAERNAWDKEPKHFASKDLQHIDDTHIDNNGFVMETLAKFDPSITKVTKAKKDTLPFFDDPITF